MVEFVICGRKGEMQTNANYILKSISALLNFKSQLLKFVFLRRFFKVKFFSYQNLDFYLVVINDNCFDCIAFLIKNNI